MLVKSIKLLDVLENLNDFPESLHKLVEFAENLDLAEVKSLSFRHVRDLFLGHLVDVLVLLVQFNT